MKTYLTEEEQKLMEVVREEWINHFNSLYFDEEKCIKLVNKLYEIGRLPHPKIIMLDSPLALQIACNLQNQVKSQVWTQVKSQVRSRVESQVKSQVWSRVESQVWSQVGRYYLEAYYGRADDLGWIAWLDYWERIGIHHNKLFLELKELFKCGIFTSIQFDKICLVSKPPVFLNRDQMGRMHCENDYAIYFNDGFGLHYIHGVYFEPELFERSFKKKSISAEEILSLKNAEQKSALIQVYKFDYIFTSLKEKEKIHEHRSFQNKDKNKPLHYELFEFKIGNVIQRVVKVQWWEKERLRETVLGVPRETGTSTCMSAIAWTFGIDDVNQYNPLIET